MLITMNIRINNRAFVAIFLFARINFIFALNINLVFLNSLFKMINKDKRCFQRRFRVIFNFEDDM